ncbi:MAG TPA: S8/S53 family peptidase [Saprospiraceae bacterium]|nr:S8/S53 family peptidase [Saprospiraceae bacterium]
MRILLTLFFSLYLGGLFAQRLEHRLGYMLVQVEKESYLQDILSGSSSRFASPVMLDKTVSKRLGIYLIHFDFAEVHEVKLLQDLRQNKKVMTAQFDHITTLRNIPNDPEFDQQWQWFNTGQTGGLIDADTDADLAWDVTTGGVTALGDTIVVAIVDDGTDYNHEDLAANLWWNHNEVDGNNIDDDDNGYIDDIHGWNAYDDVPDVSGGGHGVQVAGMIGAVGNNGLGITGMNWNVKIMMIIGGDPESAAIASYSYALDQRILYEETHGQRGAFVVATNSSWGIDGADGGHPADAPLWCAFYDSLGIHGILSAAATTNDNNDIDIVDDLPTACPSEYLLSVTALNASNERTFSGFGLTHVDFGAPGEDIYTTRKNNNYTNNSGTSFASPAAAGLIGLLYSAPCQNFAILTHVNPALAAQHVRDYIFNGVIKDPILENEIRFGGSMNAANSMQLLMEECLVCPLPTNVTADVLSDTKVIIQWESDDSITVHARYQVAGSSTWDSLFGVHSPLTLNGLTGCADYIIEFASVCADSSTDFLVPFAFKTDGCCDIPADISATSDETNIYLDWSGVFAANYFLIQWRLEGDSEWMEVVTSLQAITLDHLSGCSFYEYRIQTSCDTSESGFSGINVLRTKGCGSCIDLTYCEAASANASDGFIDSLIIGPLVNHSGESAGYTLYDALNPEFIAGETYTVWSRPGFSGNKQFEQYRIWLDVNQDGTFGNDELFVDERFFNTDTVMISQIAIPFTALAGSTRMRVSMAEFQPPFSINQDPCDHLDAGEIEDYCVNILKPNTCPPIDTLIFDAINFNSAFAFWTSSEGAIAYHYKYREVGTNEFTERATLDTTANIIDLDKCKSYEFQIRSICLTDTTSFSTYIFETKCDVAVKEETSLLAAFEVYPNPAVDFAVIRLQAIESGEYHFSVFNSFGQIIKASSVYVDATKEKEIRMDDMNAYPNGLYFIMIEKDGKVMTKKLVKM